MTTETPRTDNWGRMLIAMRQGVTIDEAVGFASQLERELSELRIKCKELELANERQMRRERFLYDVQKYMRDPERKIVCDILANGTLLPDANGLLYGFPTDGMEHHKYFKHTMTTEPAGKVWERLYPDRRKWEQLDESTKEEWRRFYLIALEVNMEEEK